MIRFLLVFFGIGFMVAGCSSSPREYYPYNGDTGSCSNNVFNEEERRFLQRKFFKINSDSSCTYLVKYKRVLERSIASYHAHQEGDLSSCAMNEEQLKVAKKLLEQCY